MIKMTQIKMNYTINALSSLTVVNGDNNELNSDFNTLTLLLE